MDTTSHTRHEHACTASAPAFCDLLSTGVTNSDGPRLDEGCYEAMVLTQEASFNQARYVVLPIVTMFSLICDSPKP